MIEQSAVEGISRLYEWGGIVTVLVLNIIALGGFSFYMIKRNEKIVDASLKNQADSTESLNQLKSAVVELSNLVKVLLNKGVL